MLRLPRSDGRTPEWHLQSPGEEKIPCRCQMLKEIVSLRMNSDTVIVQFFFMFNDGTVNGHLSLCSMMALSLENFSFVQ